MNVPLLDLRAQYATIRDEVSAAVHEVFETQRFILGETVERFERDMAAYCGVGHAIGMTSGTDALLAALMVLGVGAGDEVILPPFTFFATAGTVARVGAKPVFVDIRPDTFNLDEQRLAAAITPRTKAIIPVDLFGQLAEMETISRIAAERGIPIIEDAAQAIGSTHRGKAAGQWSALTSLSFFPTKNLGAAGDAGMLLTNDAALAERCRMVRTHGAKTEYHHVFVGANFRLDALQAAVLGVKLRHLETWIESRRRAAKRYDELLAGSGVTTPPAPAHNRHTYHQYTIRIGGGRRDALMAHFKEHGVGAKVYYPVCLHEQECFRTLGRRCGEFPAAEQAAAEVCSLPMFAELTEAQQRHVATTIRSFTKA